MLNQPSFLHVSFTVIYSIQNNHLWIFYIAILLTNYRCHDTILRLPSTLFFESTLQARSTAELHPSSTSALEFVCTSLDQTRLCNCPDFDDTEAVILLEQVCMHYVLLTVTIATTTLKSTI